MRRTRERDRVHLLRMRDAARHAQEFAVGREIEKLNTDIMFRMGLVKAVELVGESANSVSDELRSQQPQVPWADIIKARHVLVHNYWVIDQAEFWDIVQNHIPPLIDELERLIELENQRRET